MNTKTKELIDSLISYMKTGEAQGCFKKKFRSLEEDDLHLIARRIITWQIFLARGLDLDSYRFNPYETSNNAETILYPKFKVFFDNCKYINKIFTVNKKGVEWNSSVSDENKLEIINYIDNNYEVTRSI